MKLDKIITLANGRARLRFLAMERSLRAVGCDLPLFVIPYDAQQFELPKNARWHLDPGLANWLAAEKSHPCMRKYQCLLEQNFQFVDSDVCFLRDPAAVLEPFSGFIASCGHWHNPAETVTPDSRQWLKGLSTTWPRLVFNTGQFACDVSLYTLPALCETATRPAFRQACLDWSYHEQPGLNQLAIASGIPVGNLTLPPACMESTWAGDYEDAAYSRYWTAPARKPYLIHWAGLDLKIPRPIDELFWSFLTETEKRELKEQLAEAPAKNPGRTKRAARAALQAFRWARRGR
jgi:hypothetical protein